MLRTSFVLACVSLAGCSLMGPVSAPEHRAAVIDDAADRLTVGVVQSEIRVGMTTAGVVEALGSPNIVTLDERRREVWVYDRFASDTVYSDSRGGVAALILGFAGHPGGGGAGALAGGHSGRSGATSRSQRMITVIVKFDQESKVRDFSYRTSSF